MKFYQRGRGLWLVCYIAMHCSITGFDTLVALVPTVGMGVRTAN